MNYKMIFNMVGKITLLEAILLLLPACVSIIYGESSFLAFLLTACLAAVLGVLLLIFTKSKDKIIFAREGFVTVAFAWIVLSIVGALPFIFSGEIPSFADAFFETVSGFTTTGASILKNVEALSHGSLFWRSFTHWIGGMGVLVFVMAIIPADSGRSMHIMRAEMPGPVVGKLVPKIKETAKILYLIYIALTLIEIIFLLCGGVNLFESIVYSLGTAGTGGFSIKNSGLSQYSSYVQWVITAFMLIFGVNFNIYYLLIIKKFKTALKSGELWVYIALFLISTALISYDIRMLYPNAAEAIKHAAFQVSSIVTTTGYSTADFNLWPALSKGMIFLLMFIGGCAGSTAGGFKISRAMLVFKTIRNSIRHMIHPRSVDSVLMEGKSVDSETIKGSAIYTCLYFLCMGAIFFLLSFDRFNIETNATATISCFNNVGPGLGAVGPALSYADYSSFSKLVLSVAMLLGRLEIYPLLIALSPLTWTKK